MNHFTSLIQTIVTISLLTTTLNAQTANKDWPQIDGFSERLGYTESTMKPPFKLFRTVETELNIADFTYVDGILYMSSGQAQNTFQAIDISTGSVLWQKSLPNSRGGVNFHPAVSGDLVYLGGQQGLGLYALNRHSGDSVWFQPIKNLYGRNVAIKGDNIYVNVIGDALQCFNKNTGVKKWEFGEWSYQTVPLVDDDHVYHYTHDTIYALNNENGNVIWKKEYELNNFSATMVKENILYFKTKSKLVTFNSQTGELIWEKELGTSDAFLTSWNALTWTPDMIIVHEWIGDWQDTFKIQGYDHKDGKLMWSHNLEINSICPSAGFGSYVALLNGSILEIRRTTNGEIVQSFSQYSFNRRVRTKVVDQFIFTADVGVLTIFTPESTSTSDKGKMPLTWKILGNPGGPSVHLEFESNQSTEIQYSLVESSGKNASKQGSLTLKSGLSQHEIIINNLPQGNYFISIWNNSFTDSKSFIIQ